MSTQASRMRRSGAAVLVAILGLAWILPIQALAQLPVLGTLVVNITSPTSGSPVSGTIPVSASVTIVGSLLVAGGQFRLDNANLGAEDTGVPYSVPWNTTTASNGGHTLTAVARDAANNRTTSVPVTVTVSNAPPPPPMTVTRFEETDPSVTGSGAWTLGDTSRTWSGGTAAYSKAAGALGMFTFTGTSVSWIGFRAPMGGIARTFVGGGFVAEVDTYSPTEEVRTVVFTTRGLSSATHTLTIEVTGLKNPAATETAIVLDAFDVPAPTVTRVQETDPSNTYAGNWIQGNTDRAWSGGTAAEGWAAGTRATFSFSGTSVSWIGYRGPVAGIAHV